MLGGHAAMQLAVTGSDIPVRPSAPKAMMLCKLGVLLQVSTQGCEGRSTLVLAEVKFGIGARLNFKRPGIRHGHPFFISTTQHLLRLLRMFGPCVIRLG